MSGQVLASVRPSERQLAWQAMEFYGFIHFGMNTMTDREWGEGHDDPALFDPAGLDPDQWVAALKSAGMTGVILTCKHHDGFCLWPSDVTSYSVAASPWRGGRGDVVAEVADAARRHGLRFGIYLSPWDRTEASYGSGTAYDDFYVAQLTELLTRYGPVFSVWLDGANGEGPNGRRQVYDWERYYAVVRELQPDAVISVCGPDVRWCGNEAGDTRPDEWSVVPRALRDAERTADRSQQADDGAFARLVRSDERDLGSRAALAGHEDDLVWYPAEVNTSIRPGWFHHPAEDGEVRSVDELFTVYLRSVGGNSCFLLNVPPARDGLVRDTDVAVLEGLGRRIEDFRARRIEAAVTVSSGAPGDATPLTAVTLTFTRPHPVEAVVLGEDITRGQRVEHVVVRGFRDGRWTTLTEAKSVGYQRILTFPPTEVDAVRAEVAQSRDTPVLVRVAAIGAAS
ncbi:alpha-L-fucosidase [Streptomyces sp. CA-210063]|uniref:alpha-L-fucosidase n=1 Tax=Streptomyces sp. CA-210063 TaxID=2801029 RepID=UPI00214ACFF1|nr:alpha-L-fucosidase [Streptomyces sp. CA-210063]UUU28770.1 alpha-L-fucosidase [Streptomyces sp. CA-210063]